MEREEVSIVIPVRDRESLICRTLDSVGAQTWRPLHLIVVDNNSTDASVRKVSEWAASRVSDTGLRVTQLQETRPGASAARNRGLEAVTDRYVIFFDSDDEMMPGLVERAMAHAADADIVYWKAELVGLDGRRSLKPFHTDSLLRRQFYNSMLATQVYMARADFIRSIGGWEERAAVWNDWELGVRIALASPRSVAVPEVLVRIHAQAESITGRRFRDRKGEWEKTIDMIARRIDRHPDSHLMKAML
ncbi:MAG: glycosyltransferase family 2 protein, partial [Muribaculaceae bacterium]|nr:glycosyltransferase family 2 protein [Muribaculaceae bacterium]